jgi:hypothetical protein
MNQIAHEKNNKFSLTKFTKMDMRLYLDEIYDSLDHRLFEKNHVFEGQE